MIMGCKSRDAVITNSPASMIPRVLLGTTGICIVLAGAFGARSASAQAPAPNLVSACSGVSLPRSVVTDILAPVVTGVVSPVQNTVNPLLGAQVPPLAIDPATLLANAAAGQPITLQAVNRAGVLVGPADRCDVQADSFLLNTEGGIAIGGNRITGLGSNGLDAVAGEPGSIAFGNTANTAAGAVNAVAIGTSASVTAPNGVAVGAGSVAARGALAGYTAAGLAAPQTSVGEFSVGAVGAERQITNVAAGTAATDAATVGQVQGVAATVGALNDRAVQYDGADRTLVTLGGAGGTIITNVRAGALSDTSTDAVNGAQLNATNQAVAANTAAITNLGDNISNGGVGPVQYSNPGSPTTPNGGVRTNDLTLVGGAAGAVGLHNVAGGAIAPGSTDAVNGGQVYALGQNAVNAVTYDTDAAGVRTNTITLASSAPATAVAINNVAAAPLTATSTGAVNGAQLYATNQTVATAQTTANTAVALGQNSVQYDAGRTAVTFNSGGPAATLHNVAPGTSGTDAVNVSQLNSSINGALTQANNYTDSRINSLNFDLRSARRDNDAGIAGALASAGLPQAYTAGKGMIAFAGGAYGREQAFALGFSKAFSDASTVVKMSGNYDTRGRFGGAAGVGYQF